MNSNNKFSNENSLDDDLRASGEASEVSDFFLLNFNTTEKNCLQISLIQLQLNGFEINFFNHVQGAGKDQNSHDW